VSWAMMIGNTRTRWPIVESGNHISVAGRGRGITRRQQACHGEALRANGGTGQQTGNEQ
jgi:hypothetical protein